jgi:hypothetical protein
MPQASQPAPSATIRPARDRAARSAPRRTTARYRKLTFTLADLRRVRAEQDGATAVSPRVPRAPR